jgi:hypothetical protein
MGLNARLEGRQEVQSSHCNLAPQSRLAFTTKLSLQGLYSKWTGNRPCSQVSPGAMTLENLPNTRKPT